MLSRNIQKLAHDTARRARGWKLKHYREILPPEMSDADALAIRDEARRQAAVRAARFDCRPPAKDILFLQAESRRFRTPTAVRLAAERESARLAAREAEERAMREREERGAAVRRTLLAAARVARRMGFAVESSRGRDGRVSSYYCRRDDLERPIRISDHDIPATAERDYAAAQHGREEGWGGYPGPEVMIDRPRSTTWLRRALVLAAAGRTVP